MGKYVIILSVFISYNFCSGQNLRIKNNDKLVCLVSHDSTKSTIIGEKINDSITSITVYKRWKKQYNYQIVGNLMYSKLINEKFYAIFETYNEGVGASVIEINLKDLKNVRNIDINVNVSFNDVFDFEYFNNEICITSFIKREDKIKIVKQGVFKSFADTSIWNRGEPLAYYVKDSNTFILERDDDFFISLLQSTNTKSDLFENLITVTTPFSNFDCLIRPNGDGRSINIILSSMISIIYNYNIDNNSLLYQEVQAVMYDMVQNGRRQYVFYIYSNQEGWPYQTSGVLPKWKKVPFVFW